jgi:septal ring factor EnvC (AmiA/AmiB activator)
MASSARSLIPHRPRPAGEARHTWRRLPAWSMLAVLLVFAFSPAANAAPAQTDPTQARVQREEIRRQKAALAAEIDTAEATDAELAAALNTIDANVYAQEAVVADARNAVADAERRITELQAEMDQSQVEVDQLNTKLRDQAVERYVNPEGRVDTADFLQSTDFDEAENRRVLADAAGGNSRDTVDQIRATRVRLEDLQRETEAARAEADAKRQVEQAGLDELNTARAEQARVKAEWDTRIAGMQDDHSHLEGEEADLSAIIEKAEAEQRAREEAARKAQEQAAADAARARQLAAAPAASSNSSSGGSGSGSTGTTTTAPTSISGPTVVGGMIWPIAGRVSQEFHSGHAGMDIFAPMGTPIYAAMGGTVISAGWNNGGYGNLVLVSHGNGLVTAYAHMSQVIAGEGQSVGAGTILGLEGSTGNSTGPHLHFETRLNGTAVNPRNYLP